MRSALVSPRNPAGVTRILADLQFQPPSPGWACKSAKIRVNPRIMFGFSRSRAVESAHWLWWMQRRGLLLAGRGGGRG